MKSLKLTCTTALSIALLSNLPAPAQENAPQFADPSADAIFTLSLAANGLQGKVKTLTEDSDEGMEQTTVWEFDTLGRLTKNTTTGEAYFESIYTYNDKGQLVSVKEECMQEGLGGSNTETVFRRDSSGRIVEGILSGTQIDYDDNWKELRTKIPPTITTYTYDEAGHLIGKADAEARYNYKYDSAGHLVSMTSEYMSEGKWSEPTTLFYTYDDKGRVISRKDSYNPEPTPIRYSAFDPKGNWTKRTEVYDSFAESSTRKIEYYK